MAELDAEKLKIMMSAMESAKKERNKVFPEEDKAEHIDKLKMVYKELFNEEDNNLKVGGLAVSKSGLKNRKHPIYGEPVVVVQVAESEKDAHIDPSNDSGSPYYKEPLTLQVGVLDDDDELLLFYVDKRRFRPYS